jgi:hypothetical protein
LHKYYLGNFSIDKLEKEKIPIKNDTRVGYRLYTGYVNWKNTWDISDIKENITSSTKEINPLKNKSRAFRFNINDNGELNIYYPNSLLPTARINENGELLVEPIKDGIIEI